MSIIVDTNFVLRHLLDDDATESYRTRMLAAKARADGEPLIVTEGVLSEALFVLVRRFGVSRGDAAEALGALLEGGFEAWASLAARRALDLYASSAKLDAIDACLLARSELRGEEIASFDKVVNRLAGERAVF